MPTEDEEHGLPVSSSASIKGGKEIIWFYDAALLQNQPLVSKPDLVEGRMKTVGLYMLSGEEGCGKSLFAMNLALSICCGTDFLGRTTIKGRVLYIDNEIDQDEFNSRLKKMNRTYEPGTFVVLFNAPVIEEGYLEERLIALKPALVIVDSFYLATLAKENDNDSIKKVLFQLKDLTSKHNCAILFVTHFHKGTRDNILHMDNTAGAGVQNRIVDGSFLLRLSAKNEAQRIFKSGKVRSFSSKEKTPHLLILNEDTLWFEDKGEVNEEEHVAHQGGGHRTESFDILKVFEDKGRDMLVRSEVVAAAKELKYGSATADRALQDAVDAGTITKLRQGVYQLVKADDDKMNLSSDKS